MPELIAMSPRWLAEMVRLPEMGPAFATKEAILASSGHASKFMEGYRESWERVHADASMSWKEPTAPIESALHARIFSLLASLKVQTSRVAMHLSPAERQRLFKDLDNLLDVEAWHPDDNILDKRSFATFLRYVIYSQNVRWPALMISNAGNLSAMWKSNQGRLTVDFLPNDELRWILSRFIELDDQPVLQKESAAGQCHISRLAAVLAPYGAREWMTNGAA